MANTSKTLHPNAAVLLPMLEGVVKLFHPYAEGVVHDLRAGTIAAIYNNMSRRHIGEPSAIAELGIDSKDFPDVFEPYYRTNWNGHRLKCVSITARDDSGYPVALVCVNFDIAVLDELHTNLASFLTITTNNLSPVERFTVDWRQQVDTFIDTHVVEKNVALTAMTRGDKSILAKQLYHYGLFNYRDAAVYVAQKLGVSRTTIYNYLNEDKV